MQFDPHVTRPSVAPIRTPKRPRGRPRTYDVADWPDHRRTYMRELMRKKRAAAKEQQP